MEKLSIYGCAAAVAMLLLSACASDQPFAPVTTDGAQCEVVFKTKTARYLSSVVATSLYSIITPYENITYK
jgi:hypothetical protein